MKASGRKNGAVNDAIANLFPGYFALAMATGIVSVAAFHLELKPVAWALLIVNLIVYPVLCLLLVIRLVRFFPLVKADIADHARGPGFFTVVAGTCVLGCQLIIVAGQYRAALVLWFIGLGLWLLIIYTFFTAVTVRREKPSLEQGLSGVWLIAAVATQSVSVLGTLLSGGFAAYREHLLLFTLSMFLVGCMLYLLLIGLIFYRFTFLSLTSEDLTPPYWINMGAVAISTVAGERLILASQGWKFLGEILPFLKGFTLFFWAWGTWWIPLLLLLGVWRHVYKRFPLRYDPQYWGMVFPLGMYTACTFQLSKILDFKPLLIIPQLFIYVAIAAWVATFAGLIHNLFKFRENRPFSDI